MITDYYNQKKARRRINYLQSLNVQSFEPRSRPRKLSKGHLTKRMPNYETITWGGYSYGKNKMRRKRSRKRQTLQSRIYRLEKIGKYMKPQPIVRMYNHTMAPAVSALGKVQWFSTIDYCTMQVARLRNILTTNEKAFVNDVQKIHVTSAVETPSHVEVYKCVLRNPVDNSSGTFDNVFIEEAIDDGYGAGGSINPHEDNFGASLFRANRFTHNVKILSVKKHYLQPDKSIYLNLYTKRQFSRDHLSYANDPELQKGAMFYVFKVWGTPVMDTVDTARLVSTSSVGLNLIITGQMKKFKASENIPEITVETSGLGAVVDPQRVGHTQIEIEDIDNTVA